MDHNIAAYYTAELGEWNRMIEFYYREIETMEGKLLEVIQRNSIPRIALKAEAEITKLNKNTGLFNKLQKGIWQQQAALKKDGGLKEDSDLDSKTGSREDTLRSQMKEAEKAYIENKYASYDFLSATLKGYQK